MALYQESFGDRVSARLTGKTAVYFDVKEENLPSPNKMEAANMYNDAGKILAKITYAIIPVSETEKKVEIQGFAIDDWNEKSRTGERLLKWYIGFMRKRGYAAIAGGIFSTDTRTADKLDMFRNEGFEIKEIGSMAGHNEYHIELIL
jgi:hypothetical protein